MTHVHTVRHRTAALLTHRAVQLQPVQHARAGTHTHTLIHLHANTKDIHPEACAATCANRCH